MSKKKVQRKSDKTGKPTQKNPKTSEIPEKDATPSPAAPLARIEHETEDAGSGAISRAEAMNEAQQQIGNSKINRLVGDVPEKVAARKGDEEAQTMADETKAD